MKKRGWGRGERCGFCSVSDAHHAHAEGIGVEVTAQSKSHPCGGKWEKCCTSLLTVCLEIKCVPKWSKWTEWSK